MNPKAGCAGSVMNLLQTDGFNHQVDLTTGVLEEECSDMLKQFFRELRVRDAERKRQRAEELAEKIRFS
jgi:tRNA(adenine34) deaminase